MGATPMTRPGLVVLKFGGAALARVERLIERVAELQRHGQQVVVVVSAREGVTDRLLEIIEHPSDRRRHAIDLAAIDELHPGIRSSVRSIVLALRGAVSDIESVATVTVGESERVLSFGERISAAWVSQELSRADIPAVPFDADTGGLVVERVHGRPEVDLTASGRRLRPRLRRLLRRGLVPIVTGYFGRNGRGAVVTLGRGGSDYSATALGAILRAERVELVKRGASIRTGDPRLVEGTAPIVRLSYEEAEELARFGARVLHPLTLEPARRTGFEVWVRAVDDPTATTIIGPARPESAIRAVSVLSPLALLRVPTAEGLDRRRTVRRLTAQLARARISVVTWLTVPGGVGMVLEPHDAGTWGRSAAQSVTRATTPIAPLRVDLVTAVGDGILSEFGRIPASVLRAAEGVAVSARSLSFAVRASQTPTTLNVVHRVLTERPPPPSPESPPVRARDRGRAAVPAG
ncbi:MAG: aspartate kinase [Thermoplasmata archaeon]|nr:aspartate kinase [Thermoplasmata archaeon]